MSRAADMRPVLHPPNTTCAGSISGQRRLTGLDPASFRFSLLRVFDPSTPTREIDEA